MLLVDASEVLGLIMTLDRLGPRKTEEKQVLLFSFSDWLTEHECPTTAQVVQVAATRLDSPAGRWGERPQVETAIHVYIGTPAPTAHIWAHNGGACDHWYAETLYLSVELSPGRLRSTVGFEGLAHDLFQGPMPPKGWLPRFCLYVKSVVATEDGKKVNIPGFVDAIRTEAKPLQQRLRASLVQRRIRHSIEELING